MNDTLVLQPEVADFVAQVRHHLRDLPEEERQELTEGLEADLAERVAERGSGDLGDPATYARELRAAAGLERTRPRRQVPQVREILDGGAARWRRLVDPLPGDVAGFLSVLRPAWWVARAWTAVALLLLLTGRDGDIALLPAPGRWPWFGAVLLVLATIISVQIGRGRLWPGARISVPQRVLLLLLNTVAVAFFPVLAVNGSLTESRAELWFANDEYTVPGLAYDGNQVTNVYPYDAEGQPLTGVQLVDQDGHRLAVADGPCQAPWTNGKTKVRSAFPMAMQATDDDTGECRGAAAIDFPLASLPPVTLPASVAAVAGATP